MFRFALFLLVFCGLQLFAKAQYDPTKIFTHDFYTGSGTVYRSASGKPGPEYWQNQANYTIEAAFDTSTHQLKGTVKIDYINNSPDELDALWLQMDQNILKPGSRRNQFANPGLPADSSKGYRIESINLSAEGEWKALPRGTRMQIRLTQPLQSGEKIQISIAYSYTLEAKGGGGRSGIMKADGEEIYQFSYWYPRMCVYDDVRGWNTLPFIGGGEMYLDYGTIDYRLTVPSDQVVVSSGELINAGEILNQKTLKRLEKARQSDETVFIRKADEVDEPVTRSNAATTTWHFKMENTRDVAWAMSAGSIWDAARINLPNGGQALAQSVYPLKSTKEGRGWSRSTEMLKASVEDFSNKWYIYPYSTATGVAGTVGGMEFPALAFNHWSVEPDILYLLASHEIGHTWFPMIVGSNERRHPFMDEGFNTFIDIYAEADFNEGEFAPKRDGEYAPGGGNPADEIVDVIEACMGGSTLMTPADGMDYKYVHPLAYFKSAFGLVLLREVILGRDKFDYAFRKYIAHWAYKHPRPEDFFRAMDNGSGEDLTWFWNGWYYHNWQLDQSIASVEYTEGDKKKGIDISVENKDQMVMPIPVSVEEKNGSIHEFQVPVEVWNYGKTARFHVNTTSEIERIVLDPKKELPDTNRENNTWN